MAIIPFDDRDGIIWFDGKLVPWRDAKIHVLTHARCIMQAASSRGNESIAARCFTSTSTASA